MVLAAADLLDQVALGDRVRINEGSLLDSHVYVCTILGKLEAADGLAIFSSMEGALLDLSPAENEILFLYLDKIDLAAPLSVVVGESNFRVYRLTLAALGLAHGDLQVFPAQVGLSSELGHNMLCAEAHIEMEEPTRVLEDDKDPVASDHQVYDWHRQVELDRADDLGSLGIPEAQLG